MKNINVEGELYVPAVELHKCQDEYAALKQGMDSVCEEYGHLEEDYEALRAENERLREALENLFEDGEPSRFNCGRASECFSSGRCGRGAYETPLENAAGGCWFSECGCMSEAQQTAASILDEIDRAALAGEQP